MPAQQALACRHTSGVDNTCTSCAKCHGMDLQPIRCVSCRLSGLQSCYACAMQAVLHSGSRWCSQRAARTGPCSALRPPGTDAAAAPKPASAILEASKALKTRLPVVLTARCARRAMRRTATAWRRCGCCAWAWRTRGASCTCCAPASPTWTCCAARQAAPPGSHFITAHTLVPKLL